MLSFTRLFNKMTEQALIEKDGAGLCGGSKIYKRVIIVRKLRLLGRADKDTAIILDILLSASKWSSFIHGQEITDLLCVRHHPYNRG